MANSLTLAPTLGHPVVAAQGQSGGYDAIDFREWLLGMQEGVIGAGAFEVTQASGGANMTVDVAVNVGKAVVQGDSVTGQGLYVVRAHPTKGTLDVTTAHGSNPRVDQVILQVEDDEHDSSGQTRARVRMLDGTATSGATLDNRNGAASLPDSAIRLADVLVPASDTTIANSQIRDRRPWALGASFAGSHNADHATSSAAPTFAEISTTNLKCRLECSGVPLLVVFSAFGEGGASSYVFSSLLVDGTSSAARGSTPLAGRGWCGFSAILTPSAGSHLFSVGSARSGANNGTIFGASGSGVEPMQLLIRELVSGDQANNATTTG